MPHFNAGAPRQAGAQSRAARIENANRLVQETLARHGLAGALGSLPGGASSTSTTRGRLASTLTDAFSVNGPGHRMPMPEPDVPDGASWRRQSFCCDAGSRDYRLYLPVTGQAGARALVVMLHGCTQTPEDFAAGTAMNDLADRHGFIVAYPVQARGANAQSCWNWFSRGDQRRNRGEPAILAGIARQVMADHGVPADRVFVAGLSAGGAMAVILGEVYPDLFTGVGVHSGLSYGAARDVGSAYAAMGGTPMRDDTRPRPGKRPRTIVFHGAADATVHPVNGGLVARDALAQGAGPQIQTTETGRAGGRSFHKETARNADGEAVLEHWVVDGMGHAWSGGRAAGSYTDPDGPDASAEIVRFFLSPADRSA